MNSNSYQRHIDFEAVFNFRDLGGYHTQDGRAVRWRRLFRSGELFYMTEADLGKANDELGIATVVDLREPATVANRTNQGLLESAIGIHNIWLVEDFDKLNARYPAFPGSLAEDYSMRFRESEFGHRLVTALKAIAEQDSQPAVFHCSAGKDRAGMLAAVILGVLGVSDEDIVSDYAMTARNMPRTLDRWWSEPESFWPFAELPRTIWDARPETMEYLLDWVRNVHGSMRAYAKSQGADESLFQRLEDTLLE